LDKRGKYKPKDENIRKLMAFLKKLEAHKNENKTTNK